MALFHSQTRRHMIICNEQFSRETMNFILLFDEIAYYVYSLANIILWCSYLITCLRGLASSREEVWRHLRSTGVKMMLTLNAAKKVLKMTPIMINVL